MIAPLSREHASSHQGGDNVALTGWELSANGQINSVMVQRPIRPHLCLTSGPLMDRPCCMSARVRSVSHTAHILWEGGVGEIRTLPLPLFIYISVWYCKKKKKFIPEVGGLQVCAFGRFKFWWIHSCRPSCGTFTPCVTLAGNSLQPSLFRLTAEVFLRAGQVGLHIRQHVIALTRAQKCFLSKMQGISSPAHS